MNYKLSARIRQATLFVTIMLCVSAFALDDSRMTVAAVAVYLIGLVQYTVFHRCPHCGVGFRYLRNDGCCPNCGEKLE